MRTALFAQLVALLISGVATELKIRWNSEWDDAIANISAKGEQASLDNITVYHMSVIIVMRNKVF